MSSEEDVEAILNMKTIAVVGCSPKPGRPSHGVAAYLKSAGYRVIPVHPGVSRVLGETCYPSLKDIPGPVDVVDVFRRSEFALDVVREAVAVKAKAVWLQDGVESAEAEELARRHGLRVVMNDCMMRRHAMREHPGE